MAESVIVGPPPQPLDGRRLHSVKGPVQVAKFQACVDGATTKPGGEMTLRLSIDADQFDNASPLIKQIGGVVFEVTFVRRPVVHHDNQSD